MEPTQTDSHAIAASLDDPARFEVVFRRHYQSIRAYLQRRVGLDLGEELAAQTFVHAFDRRESYDLAFVSAKPWLFAIATNLVRHHVRDEARHLRTLQTMPMLSIVDDEDDRLTSMHLGPVLAAALATLPQVDRDALLLFVHAGLRYEEIATALHVPVGTVRSRIHRAKLRLREQLEGVRDINDA